MKILIIVFIDEELAMTDDKNRASDRDLIKITDFESREPDYIQWKRGKIEQALRHADEHPDDFITEKELWNKHGIEY